IGLIGFGAIGRTVARAVAAGAAGDTTIVAVLVRDPAKYEVESTGYPYSFYGDPDLFFDSGMDMVVEVAGHDALRRYAERALRSGMDYLTVSVGAFADDELLERVRSAATASGRRVLIPSGAIGGLDAISAGAIGKLDEVTITSRKPPVAWKGTVAEREVDLDAVTEPVCLYEGPARKAAALYPQNVNVQAALSLAGIGMDLTRSRVFADPSVIQNTHEILARGAFGEVRISISNIPSDESPKTGRITAMSVTKAIRNLTAPIVVGL
ncbi:MAG TPA: aspartate dehydrogenase, partial [Chloroflexota bacterium]|nr:aspartate dehydrogenase [Chloroflexota bacterium]